MVLLSVNMFVEKEEDLMLTELFQMKDKEPICIFWCTHHLHPESQYKKGE